MSSKILSLEEFIPKIPQNENNRIFTIMQRRGVTKEEVTKILYKFCCDPWFISEFPTLEDRISYAMQATHTQFMSGQQLQNHPLVIPFGYSAIQKTRSGVLRSLMYVAEKTNQGLEKRVIVCEKDASSIYKNILLYYAYKNVQLGQYFGGTDLIADAIRSDFSEPKKLSLTPPQLIDRLNIPRVGRLIDMIKYPCKTGPTGYPDRLDLKIIRGMVVGNRSVFIKKDGTEGARYSISDYSLSNDTSKLSEGTFNKSTRTVWIAPELPEYPTYSECDYIGTISVRRDPNEKDASGKAKILDIALNAINVMPIHTKVIEESE